MAGSPLVHGIKYRIKPRTIKVNGLDVPEPVSNNITYGASYFSAALESRDFFSRSTWTDSNVDHGRLSRGLIHLTKEAAIAHAKAMLGIDPNE